jgi:hypothetical protein
MYDSGPICVGMVLRGSGEVGTLEEETHCYYKLQIDGEAS